MSTSYRYFLRNIQTGEIEYTGLMAGEVHRITGIPSQRVSHYARIGKIHESTWKVSRDEEDYSGIWTDELCAQWDCVRKMVLGGLRRIKNKKCEEEGLKCQERKSITDTFWRNHSTAESGMQSHRTA